MDQSRLNFLINFFRIEKNTYKKCYLLLNFDIVFKNFMLKKYFNNNVSYFKTNKLKKKKIIKKLYLKKTFNFTYINNFLFF
jgi:hypothetical protein